jgi:hypothetical protein
LQPARRAFTPVAPLFGLPLGGPNLEANFGRSVGPVEPAATLRAYNLYYVKPR